MGALNIDLKELYARLYDVLISIPCYYVEDPELVRSILYCFSLMTRDKKQVSHSHLNYFSSPPFYLSLKKLFQLLISFLLHTAVS